jgi:hypothetical protein
MTDGRMPPMPTNAAPALITMSLCRWTMQVDLLSTAQGMNLPPILDSWCLPVWVCLTSAWLIATARGCVQLQTALAGYSSSSSGVQQVAAAAAGCSRWQQQQRGAAGGSSSSGVQQVAAGVYSVAQTCPPL